MIYISADRQRPNEEIWVKPLCANYYFYIVCNYNCSIGGGAVSSLGTFLFSLPLCITVYAAQRKFSFNNKLPPTVLLNLLHFEGTIASGLIIREVAFLIRIEGWLSSDNDYIGSRWICGVGKQVVDNHTFFCPAHTPETKCRCTKAFPVFISRILFCFLHYVIFRNGKYLKSRNVFLIVDLYYMLRFIQQKM